MDAAARELAAKLADALDDERTEILVELVRGWICRILKLPGTDLLDRRQRLTDFGVDSLMALELRRRLERALGLAPRTLPATLVFDYTTPAAIAGYLLGVLYPPEGADAPPSPSPVPAVEAAPALGMDEIDAMTDDEVEMLLLRKLERLQAF